MNHYNEGFVTTGYWPFDCDFVMHDLFSLRLKPISQKRTWPPIRANQAILTEYFFDSDKILHIRCNIIPMVGILGGPTPGGLGG